MRPFPNHSQKVNPRNYIEGRKVKISFKPGQNIIKLCLMKTGTVHISTS
jgi:hypothetical protein